MIKLYSTGCPKCKVILKKLQDKNVKFELIEDNQKVVDYGKEKGIYSAPILEVDNMPYEFTKAIRVIETL